MRQKLRFMFIALSVFLLASCKSNEYKNTDLIGKWAGYNQGVGNENYYSEMWFSDSIAITWLSDVRTIIQMNYEIDDDFIQYYGFDQNDRKEYYPVTLKIINVHDDTLKIELIEEGKEIVLTKIDKHPLDIFEDQEKNYTEYYDEFDSRSARVMNMNKETGR